MKSLWAMASIVTAFGCATTTTKSILDPTVQVFQYSIHPVHGELRNDNPLVKADLDYCEQASYNKPVIIDGKAYSSQRELMSLYMEYNRPIYKSLQEKYSEQRITNAGIEGANIAVSVMQGKVYSPNFKTETTTKWDLVEKEFRSIDHPEHIDTIITMKDNFDNCFSTEKHWTKSKVQIEDTATGKVIQRL